MYADDTNLFLEAKDLNNFNTLVNSELFNLSQWCFKNKLTVNLDKTNYIVIKNWQNRFIFNDNVLTLDKKLLPRVQTIKFLGIYIDEHLNFSTHIQHLRSTLRPSIGILYRASQYLPQYVLKLVYNSFIHSKINYCLEVYGTAPKTSIEYIHKMQKRAIRIINQGHYLSHTAPLFKKSCILPVYSLYQYRVLLRTHANFQLPSSTSNTTITTPHPYPTRFSATNLPLPPSRSRSGHRSPDYQSATLWNGLPSSLKCLSKHSKFRSSLKRHLLG